MTEIDDGRFVGKQIRSFRLLRGHTQQYLADVMGLSRTAVTMYETGRRPVDSRELLYRFAQTLQVSVGDLTGHSEDKVNPNLVAFHAAIPAIEAALMTAGDNDDSGYPREVPALLAMTEKVLALRAANDYSALGLVLPSLITDLYRRTMSGSDKDRTAMQRALAEVSFVTASSTKGLGYTPLAWTAARACHDAAAEAGYPAGLAAAEFARSQVLLATPGSLRASLSRAVSTGERLQSQLRKPAELELYGMLHLQAALTSAAVGLDPEPHLREAEETASRTGQGGSFGLHFGSENVAIWRMSVALEQRAGGRAVEIARTLEAQSIPTADRRSRYYIELGRAFALESDYRQSMNALLHAELIAPQKVRSRTVVRELVGHMLRKSRRDLVNGDLGRLAKRVGAVPT